jgi:hypothetical protein
MALLKSVSGEPTRQRIWVNSLGCVMAKIVVTDAEMKMLHSVWSDFQALTPKT